MCAVMNVKRQKTMTITRPMDIAATSSSSDSFQGIGLIEYKPDLDYLFANNENQLHFRYYNATERIHGRAMEDWLKPSLAIGNTKTLNSNRTFEMHKRFVKMHFEICKKLGVKLWSGYDTDVFYFGETIEDYQTIYDQSLCMFHDFQQKTAIKPLWIGVKFFRCPNGSITNPDSNTVIQAGAQIKRGLDAAYKLNAQNFIINIDQEGYQQSIGTDFRREIKHLARFLKLVVEYRDKIGYRGQLLIDSTQNKFDWIYKYAPGCFGIIALLKNFNHDRYFKIAVKPGYNFNIAHMYESVGSIEVLKNKHYEIGMTTSMFKLILESGGFNQGGLTFHCWFTKKYSEPKEILDGYIHAIDMYAKGLRCAAKMVVDGQINKTLQLTYQSFLSGWGAKLMTSEANFEECDDLGKTVDKVTPKRNWDSILYRYIDII